MPYLMVSSAWGASSLIVLRSPLNFFLTAAGYLRMYSPTVSGTFLDDFIGSPHSGEYQKRLALSQIGHRSAKQTHQSHSGNEHSNRDASYTTGALRLELGDSERFDRSEGGQPSCRDLEDEVRRQRRVDRGRHAGSWGWRWLDNGQANDIIGRYKWRVDPG